MREKIVLYLIGLVIDRLTPQAIFGIINHLLDRLSLYINNTSTHYDDLLLPVIARLQQSLGRNTPYKEET